MKIKFTRSYSNLTLLTFLFFLLPIHAKAYNYNFVELDNSSFIGNPTTDNIMPQGLNDKGDVVGVYFNSFKWHGFLYNIENRAYTTIDNPYGNYPELTDVNNNGSIVGNNTYESSNSQGYLYQNGLYSNIVPQNALSSVVSGINDLGDVVGSYSTSNKAYGFIYHNSIYSTLKMENDIDSVDTPRPLGINNKGEVVGIYVANTTIDGLATTYLQGFVNSNGIYSTVSVPEGKYGTFASGINDSGDIVGVYYLCQDSPACLKSFIYFNGAYTVFEKPGAFATNIYDINNIGQIVGTYIDENMITHGFVATPVNVPTPSAFWLFLSALFEGISINWRRTNKEMKLI